MSTVHDYEKVLDKSDTSVAAFTRERSTLEKIQHFLHSNPAAVPLIVLVISVSVFGLILGSKFFNALPLILQQVAISAIVGAAQTLVILTAGIDLSVGAIMVLSSVIMGQLAFHGFVIHGVTLLPPLPAPLALLFGFGVGALCGWLNGFLIARMKLPPFIVTLGTWQIILASNFLYSANETIRSQDVAAEAPLLQLISGNRIIIVMFLLVFLLWYVLNHTAWGRYLYAIGDDPDAAELSGVRVKRMLTQVYVLSGLICALAGWVLIGRLGSVSPTSGQFANIESITAVVIGGISLFGGRGSILGMIFGALIVGVFQLGLRMIGTDPQWTFLLIGVLIIGAVAVDQWIRKVSG
ncbi:MAG TPA: ABC transporter permease [Aestuariivirga sp.]|jgi:fructose transport system permease protein|nr:ABC transporter permease [Aestuariivirga sp.]